MDTIIREKPDRNDLLLAAKILGEGGLVAFPTETVYGLGANALLPAAAKKVYAAKGRPSDNPLIIHLAKAEDAEKYAHTCPLYYRLAMAFMPGPLTVILKKKDVIPYEVTGGLDTVAVRVPSHRIAHSLLQKCSFPIAAPSANLSGKPSPTELAHVVHDMDGRIDMILGGGRSRFGVESTIVSINRDELTLLRPGAVTPEMLTPFCAGLRMDKCLTAPLAEGERPLAPGMKYKHYAPAADVILLDGTKIAVQAYMQSAAKDENTGFLCDREAARSLPALRTVSFGAGPEDEARLLFSCLRAFDDMPQIKKIYARLPEKEGIGLAVYNRLAKAAGFTIVSCDR